MHKYLIIFTACAILTKTNTASAYDVRTHTALTSEAVAQSKLTRDPSTSALFKRLGLIPINEPIGKRYVDIGGQLTSRIRDDFEKKIMGEVLESNTLGPRLPADYSLTGWFMRGAIREDDNKLETPNTDEPGGPFSRVFGHFFDPQNDRGLTFFGNRDATSVEWALTPGATADGRENHFKITDAREAMWRALTLKKLDSGALTDPPFTSNGQGFDSTAAQKEDERNAYWATTFRAIGDVVHLLQDTAQPQHTRNDAHSGYGCFSPTNPDAACLAGHDSFFEKYIKARTLLEETFTIVEAFRPPNVGDPPPGGIGRGTSVKPLIYDGYTPPKFTKFADYFSTGAGSANASGLGLANYGNRGFYSFGTNINNPSVPDLPSPHPYGSGLGTATLLAAEAENMVGIKLQAGITFRTGTVQDTVTNNPATNIKLSTESAWDQFLIQRGQAPRYTLNYYNYDDQARLLIPRAVGYSAGLIDYFFRGELEISLPDEGVYAVVDYSKESTKDTGGFNKVKLKLRNKTPRIEPSGGGAGVDQNLETSGTVVAVAKFRRNKCYIENTLQGEIPVLRKNGKTFQQIYDECRATAEEIVVSDPITLPRALAYSDADPVALTFDFKDRIPINVIDLYLQVVYRGKLGDETDAVVVSTKDVSEPTFIKISDYRIFYDALNNCKFVPLPDPATYTSAFKIAFTTAAAPTFVVEADINSTQYSMVAVLADNGEIKSRAEAVPNKYDPPFTLQFNSALSTVMPIRQLELNGEAQPAPGAANATTVPEYRRSQFEFTAPNSVTLSLGPAIEISNVGGMFIDFGLFVDNVDLPSGCTNTQKYPSFTRFHSLYPPYSPVVPKALKKITF